MNSTVDWDHLVQALRDELQEKGGLIRLLNQQTETLYRRDAAENERLEEQIRAQLRLISRCTHNRELALRLTAASFRLSDRMEERLKQNQGLKERFIFETSSTV